MKAPRLLLFVPTLSLVVGPAHAQQPGTETVGLWQVSTGRARPTQAPFVVLQLSALGTWSPVDADQAPVLFVRCVGRDLSVFFGTDWILSAEEGLTALLLRWGTDDPLQTNWGLSDDQRNAFATDPRAFLDVFKANPDLRVEFHLMGDSARVVIFDGRGLVNHMARVDAACPPAVSDTRLTVDDIRMLVRSGQVVPEAIVHEPPVVLERPRLSFPRRLRETGVSGRVVVQAIIDTAGRAERASVRILESPDPGFNHVARDLVLRSRFRPARVNGRTVRVLINMPIDFTIKSQRAP